MKVFLSVIGSVAFSLIMRCVSAVFDLPREDLAYGALAYMAIYAIISAREGGAS